MSKRHAVALAALAFAALFGCGDNTAPIIPTPDGILLSSTTATMEIADVLSVTASYSGTQAFAPDDLVWVSSDATKVSVTGSGGHATVTAIAAGHANVTVSGEGQTAILSVDVTPAHVIAIAMPVQPRLAAGTTLPIQVTASYSDGSTADVTALATITTDTPAVATVTNGVITGIKKGDSQLHATYAGQEVSTLVTVTAALLVSIAVTPADSTIPFGLKPQLVATGTFTDTTTQNLSASVTWTSSVTTIATISATGVITTVAVGGPTTITATKGTISGTTTLSVSNVALQSIAITPHNPTVALGVKPQLTATATYSDATTADVTTMATWSSDTVATATIDTLGKATTLAQGTATITATFQTATDTSLLTVGPKALATLAITPDVPTVPLGTTQQFTATGTYTDATTGNFTSTATWSSDTTANLTIDAAGLATTHAQGTATLTAAVGAITDTDLVTVGAPAIASIVVTPAAATLSVGVDQAYTAMATLTDATLADVTASVTWSSTDTTNAPIASTGVVSTLGVASGITIEALAGNGISGTTTLSTSAAAIGTYTQIAGNGLTPCYDGVKFSFASDFAYGCFTDGPFVRGAATSTTVTLGAPTTAPANATGSAIVAHSSMDAPMLYLGAPNAALANFSRSADNGATFPPASSFLLNDSAANPRFFYTGRQQPGVGNMLGTWDPGAAGTPQAIVLTGNGASPTTANVVATATGTVRSLEGTGATNLWVAVLGQTPVGAAATGGVFRSTNSATTWTETDTGWAAADVGLAFTVAVDPTTGSQTVYVGLQGGSRVYKTTDNGATWTASASGLPSHAKVNRIYLDPANVATVYAATSLGLFVSADSGATWTSAGFLGRDVRGVARSSISGSTVLLAAVHDSLADGTSGIYINQ